MGRGSGAEASTFGGHRLGADEKLRGTVESRRRLLVGEAQGGVVGRVGAPRRAPTPELGRWCRAAPGAAVRGTRAWGTATT
jgi:hypothetical protein